MYETDHFGLKENRREYNTRILNLALWGPTIKGF